MLVSEKKANEAWVLIEQLLQRDEFHVSEYHLLVNVIVSCQILKGNPEGTRFFYESGIQELGTKRLPPFEDYLCGGVRQIWD